MLQQLLREAVRQSVVHDPAITTRLYEVRGAQQLEGVRDLVLADIAEGQRQIADAELVNGHEGKQQPCSYGTAARIGDI